jgi:calcium-dependent protein kinase
MNQIAGSLFYIAPGQIIQSYTEKCDIWSIGVIAYTCLLGHFPFDDVNPETVYEKICTKKF